MIDMGYSQNPFVLSLSKYWRLAWRILAALLAAVIALTILFLLAAWIGSSIPRNPNWTEPAQGVEIMLGSNGIHTELVLPLITTQKDWRADFPAADIPASARPYTHIAVSWGEREVFLGTPTWADLDLATAFNAATGGDGLLHVAHYVRPAPGPANRPLRLRPEEYARLVDAIEAQILPPEERRRHPGYARHDVFYEAPGHYHIGNTCNQWTSDTFAAAGVKTGLWTPLTGGVMKWVEWPQAAQ